MNVGNLRATGACEGSTKPCHRLHVQPVSRRGLSDDKEMVDHVQNNKG